MSKPLKLNPDHPKDPSMPTNVNNLTDLIQDTLNTNLPTKTNPFIKEEEEFSDVELTPIVGEENLTPACVALL